MVTAQFRWNLWQWHFCTMLKTFTQPAHELGHDSVSESCCNLHSKGCCEWVFLRIWVESGAWCHNGVRARQLLFRLPSTNASEFRVAEVVFNFKKRMECCWRMRILKCGENSYPFAQEVMLRYANLISCNGPNVRKCSQCDIMCRLPMTAIKCWYHIRRHSKV